MEKNKFYTQPVNSKFAKSEEERKVIKLYNSVAIGVVKAARKYGSTLSAEDIEDITVKAFISAAEHVNPSDPGALAYGDRCGHNALIKYAGIVSKERKMFSRLEQKNYGKDEWVSNTAAYGVCSESSADDGLITKEDDNDSRLKSCILWKCYSMLSQKDQQLIEMKRQDIPYKDIAAMLGTNIGAATKQMFDVKKRFSKLLHSNGYFA